MSQKNKAGHSSECQTTVENAVITTEVSKTNVSTQKRKEDAKRILYLNRV
ncbi:MAG: hypothetical protein ACXV2C_01665 [Candidatus Bathyarchaeia archaeon]